MSAARASYATMITNFDSTQQLREWESIRADCASTWPDERSCPDISSMWARDEHRCPCERLLNDHVEFATHFAGIIRTAYLYCPKILLTDAELLDGIFFLALGPTAG